MKILTAWTTVFLMSALFICASIYGWRGEWFRRQLKNYGENTQAIVTSSSSSRAGAGHSPAHLAYTFSYSNQTYSGNCFITDSAQRALHPGDSVGVRFLPGQPEVNWPVGVANISFYQVGHLGLIVVTCASGLGIFLLVAIPLKLNRRKHAQQSLSRNQHQHA